MFDVYLFGALRVLVDQVTGEKIVQDRISGDDAALHFSPGYVALAEQYATLAHESLYAET